MKKNKNIFLSFVMTFVVCPALYNMSADDEHALRWKVGQLLMVGFEGTAVDDTASVVQDMQQLNLGSIILFAKNIMGPTQLRMLTTQLQKYSPTPLIIAADVEGGQVNRLKPELGFIKIPSAQDMGKGDFSQTLAISRLVAEQLAEMGINANLAPDVDVNINPDNPIIGKRGRSFSEDPQIVFGHAMAFITSHREKNIITAAKHFLGHGSSDKDTHKGLVDVTHSYKKEAELLPFSRLIEAHAIDMIMTAHVMHRDFDPEYPATMSSKIIQDLLRGQLGFDGVVISDDLGMGAIVQEYSFDEAILRSLMAGCDLLIVARNIKDMFPADLLVESSGASALGESAAKHAIDVICQAVKDGRLSKARVLEAYERVIKLKKKYGIIKD